MKEITQQAFRLGTRTQLANAAAWASLPLLRLCQTACPLSENCRYSISVITKKTLQSSMPSLHIRFTVAPAFDSLSFRSPPHRGWWPRQAPSQSACWTCAGTTTRSRRPQSSTASWFWRSNRRWSLARRSPTAISSPHPGPASTLSRRRHLPGFPHSNNSYTWLLVSSKLNTGCFFFHLNCIFLLLFLYMMCIFCVLVLFYGC